MTKYITTSEELGVPKDTLIKEIENRDISNVFFFQDEKRNKLFTKLEITLALKLGYIEEVGGRWKPKKVREEDYCRTSPSSRKTNTLKLPRGEE